MGGSGGEHVSCLWLKKPELSKYLGSIGPCLSLFERSQIYGSKGTARPAVPWGRDFLEEFTHVTEKTPWWSFGELRSRDRVGAECLENSTQFVFTVRLCLLHRQQGQWREKEGRGRGRRDGGGWLAFPRSV